MCGICGIALPDESSRTISESTLNQMRDSIVHRGPDAFGSFIERGIALGHRRLSIVDVAHGAQPMSSVDDALRIVYNGEVFNHPMLSEELRADGVKYKTHCDTETVLHVYERERERTPERLRGMFAFAIWDRRRRELFIARDRFGVKPLYYALLPDGSLYFASEIKAILASGAVSPRLNMAMLPDYLANHAPSGDETLFEGIKRLPAGHTLRWKNGAMKIEQFWDLHFNHSPITDARDERELVAEYRDRLREAVRLRLMADVPLGSFLSGGIDSAAITALMSDLTGGGVKTFSVAFNEREANEFEYARLLANRYKTDHHEIVVSPDEFFGALPDLVWHEDEPIAHASSIPLNFVSRLAAQHVKVVLTGEGSDETLAGYNRYRVTIYNMALGRRYERMTVPSLRAAVKSGIESLPANVSIRQKLSRTFFTRPASLTDLYFENFAVFGRARQAQVLSASTKEAVSGIDPYAAYECALARTDASSLLDRLLYADTKTYLHELLMKQDQMSMAASIESRVPFLDHPLVEFASGLPERLKLRGLTTKWVLRESMKDVLPPEILSRKKMGFPVPIGAWFRGAYRTVVDEYVLGPRAMQRGLFDPNAVRSLVEAHARGENHSERLWSLVNLEMWQRIFLDGEPRESMRITAAR